MIDYRSYTIEALQAYFDQHWITNERVSVDGCSGRNFLIHFQDPRDLQFAWFHAPCSMQGALIAIEHWIPNSRLNDILIQSIPLWVQIWGMPLEYQSPTLAVNMGSMIGEVLQLDWEDRLPRNLAFLGLDSALTTCNLC